MALRRSVCFFDHGRTLPERSFEDDAGAPDDAFAGAAARHLRRFGFSRLISGYPGHPAHLPSGTAYHDHQTQEWLGYRAPGIKAP